MSSGRRPTDRILVVEQTGDSGRAGPPKQMCDPHGLLIVWRQDAIHILCNLKERACLDSYGH